MKNGEFRQFLISTDLIELGGKHCLLTIDNDITERKRAKEALRALVSRDIWPEDLNGRITTAAKQRLFDM